MANEEDELSLVILSPKFQSLDDDISEEDEDDSAPDMPYDDD